MTNSTEILYLVSTGLFVFSLKWMNDPKRPAAESLPEWGGWPSRFAARCCIPRS